MANERALGISFMWAAQAWPQLAAIFGEQEARTLVGLTNNLIVFGGSKDVAFNRRSPTCSARSASHASGWQTGQMGGRQVSADDISILTPAEVRQLKERHALVLSENGAPIIARCTDASTARQGSNSWRTRHGCAPGGGRPPGPSVPKRARNAALVEARRRGLTRDHEDILS
jgi:type IV secretion system protein VirD4